MAAETERPRVAGMRIEVSAPKGQTPTVAFDGVPQDEERPDLRWADSVYLPHVLIYLRGQRLYDTEIWVNGDLAGRVPPKSAEVDAAYDRHERGDAEPDFQEPDEYRTTDSEAGHAERLKALQAEIAASPGRRAEWEWKGLSRTFSVHQRNTHELTSLLQLMETDPEIALEMFQNVRPPEVHDALLGELDQRLHNFVASAVSLVDHTRRLFAGYEGTHMGDAYEERKNALAAKPVVGFVRDLRNYLLHRSIPFIGFTVTFGEQMREPRATMEVSVANLKRWNGWKAPAKAFLEAGGESIKLSEVPGEHTNELNELYEWVFRQFRGMHKADVYATNVLVDEYNWVLSGGAKGRPRRPGRMAAQPPPLT